MSALDALVMAAALSPSIPQQSDAENLEPEHRRSRRQRSAKYSPANRKQQFMTHSLQTQLLVNDASTVPSQSFDRLNVKDISSRLKQAGPPVSGKKQVLRERLLTHMNQTPVNGMTSFVPASTCSDVDASSAMQTDLLPHSDDSSDASEQELGDTHGVSQSHTPNTKKRKEPVTVTVTKGGVTIQVTQPCAKRFVDGHWSHVTTAALDKLKAMGVHVVQLPAHLSWLLQMEDQLFATLKRIHKLEVYN